MREERERERPISILNGKKRYRYVREREREGGREGEKDNTVRQKGRDTFSDVEREKVCVVGKRERERECISPNQSEIIFKTVFYFTSLFGSVIPPPSN